MYDPGEKLYYLADFNEKIAVGNYCDFYSYNSLNALVSENPEDKNSWHFANMQGEGGEEYFFDPDYALASYDAMEKAYGCFHDRYGFNSVDKSGMPCLLLLYQYDDVLGYPEYEEDFINNAMNAGQVRDWNVTTTSPMSACSVEIGTLTHEFTHGINAQLTNSQYLNQQGAVMEGYADSIGEQIAYLYGYKWEEFKWQVGSQYCAPMRSFDDPLALGSPKYIGGTDYVEPIKSDCMNELLDCGGVHENSGVVNYLCYELCNSEFVKEADRLTMEENLDCWFETLYMSTYDTNYEDIAHFLIFAAEHMPGMSEGKKETVKYLTDLYGFTGNRDELEKLIGEEECYEYELQLNLPEDGSAEGMSFGASYVAEDGSGRYCVAGEMDENGSIELKTDAALGEGYWNLGCGRDLDEHEPNYVSLPGIEESTEINVQGYDLQEGDAFDTEGGYILSISYVDTAADEEDEETSEIQADVTDYMYDFEGQDGCEIPAAGRYVVLYEGSNGAYELAIINAK